MEYRTDVVWLQRLSEERSIEQHKDLIIDLSKLGVALKMTSNRKALELDKV